MIYRRLKRVLIALFTNNPYKIKTFTRVYKGEIGEALEKPESLSSILYSEVGEMINYQLSLKNQSHLASRYIGEQKRFIFSGIFKAPNRLLYSISYAGVIGQLGLVYDVQKRVFINESGKEWIINLKDSPYLNAFNLPNKTYLHGITLSCLTNGADGGFYHFLFESLVKVGFCEKVLNNVDHILFNGPVTDWKLKWIKQARVDISKVIWVDSTSHFVCDQLLFTNGLINDQQINDWCVLCLKNLFSINESPEQYYNKKVIWITRKNNSSRNIEWEDEIANLFPEIEKVDLTELDLANTIKIMLSATHVIAPHGAGLSNIFMCKKGTKVLELYPKESSFQPCYLRLSDVCGLEHHTAYLNFKTSDDRDFGDKYAKGLLSDFLC